MPQKSLKPIWIGLAPLLVLGGLYWLHTSLMVDLETEDGGGHIPVESHGQGRNSSDSSPEPKTGERPDGKIETERTTKEGRIATLAEKKKLLLDPSKANKIAQGGELPPKGAPLAIQRVRGANGAKSNQGQGAPNAINRFQSATGQVSGKGVVVVGGTENSSASGASNGTNPENAGVAEGNGLQGDPEINTQDVENELTADEELVSEEENEGSDLASQIFPFSGTIYSTSSRKIPFANIYKTDIDTNQFYDAVNSGQENAVFQNAVYVASSDENGGVSFELSGSDNAILLLGEYAGVVRIIFDNKVDGNTSWKNSYVTLEDVEEIYTFRGKVVDEDDKPLRYAEILIDESLLDADYDKKGMGSHAKTDKYGKYIFNVKVESFPFDVICKVKDRLPEKETIQYDNGTSLLFDNVDFVVPKDKFHAVIKKGLEWLISQQDSSTGAFGRHHPQISTSLACLSLIAQGHISKSSVYQENLRKGLIYLCQEAKKKNDYYFGEGRMYSHALVSLALSESLGVLREKQDNDMVREVLEKTVQQIVDAQNQDENKDHEGGWRYTPKSKDSDLSVSALQILALHSAVKNGVGVPNATLEKASAYVRNMYSDSMKAFLYAKPNKTTTAMRSAGVVAMNVLKLNNSNEDLNKITNSARVLLNYRPDKRTKYFWYTNYYAFTAASILGGRHDDFIPSLKETIIEKQMDSGAFEGEKKYGEVYSTAFALIILGSPIVY